MTRKFTFPQYHNQTCSCRTVLETVLYVNAGPQYDPAATVRETQDACTVTVCELKDISTVIF
jgi:hypothetical protein